MANNNIVELQMDNGINVKIDKGNIIGVSRYDLEDHISELFKFKKKYIKKEVIKLSSICNICCDLLFCGIDKETKEIVFKLC